MQRQSVDAGPPSVVAVTLNLCLFYTSHIKPWFACAHCCLCNDKALTENKDQTEQSPMRTTSPLGLDEETKQLAGQTHRRSTKRQRDEPERISVATSDTKSSDDSFQNASELTMAVQKVNDMDLSSLPLGVLLNRFLLKSFKDESGEEVLFRGKVVSYLVPSTNVSDGRLLPVSVSKKRGNNKPLDYGLYRIHFDDGDQCDMHPHEVYKCIMLYDQQVSNSECTHLDVMFYVFYRLTYPGVSFCW